MVPKGPKIYFLGPISRLRPGQVSQIALIPEPSGQGTSICSFPPGKGSSETGNAYLASFSGDRSLPFSRPVGPAHLSVALRCGAPEVPPPSAHSSTGAGPGGRSWFIGVKRCI